MPFSFEWAIKPSTPSIGFSGIPSAPIPAFIIWIISCQSRKSHINIKMRLFDLQKYTGNICSYSQWTLCGFCIIREKAIRRATFNRTHFRTHFYFRPPKYSIFKHKKRKQNACNLNEISIAATIIRGSNPSPATIKLPYFTWNTVVFLTFWIILQFRKTCFYPILTPIGALY